MTRALKTAHVQALDLPHARQAISAADGQRDAGAYLHAVAPRLVLAPRIRTTRTATDVTVSIDATVATLVAGLRFPVTATAHAPVERFVSTP